MTEARLIVDAETLRQGNLGPATGDIWIVLDGFPFPIEGWNDFVVVILGAWVSAVLRLLRGFSDCEIVDFMEGPYAVEIRITNAGTVRLRAIENWRNRVAQVDTRMSLLIENLLVASEGILNACRAKNCWSRDADDLKDNLPALRREALRLNN